MSYYRRRRRKKRARSRRRSSRSRDLIRRYSKSKREDPTVIYDIVRLPTKRKSLISTVTRAIKSRSPPRAAQGIKLYRKEVNPCVERTERADRLRRKNFFRAKSKGSTSVRPEHERRHKRC